MFDTNRKLRKHLHLHRDLKPGMDQSPSEEQGFEETQAWRRESQRKRNARDAEMDVVPAGEPASPAGVDAHLTPSRTSLKKLLSKPRNQKSHRMAKCVVEHDSKPWSPEAGTSVDEEDLLSCSPESRQEPPRPDALVQGSLQLHPQEQADRGGLTASRQKQKMQVEQRTPKQLDSLKQIRHPKMSLEADLQTELEDGRREQRQASLAHRKPDSPSRPGEERRV